MSRFLDTLLAFGHLLGPGVDEELRKAHKDALNFDSGLERSGTGIAAVTMLWAGREIVKLRNAEPLARCLCTDRMVPQCPLHGESPRYKPVDPPPQRELTAQVDADLLERAIRAETELSRMRSAQSDGSPVTTRIVLDRVRVALGLPLGTDTEDADAIVAAIQLALASDHATPAEVRYLQRFMDLAAKVWALFPDDPIRGTPAQSYLERLEVIVGQDLLVPKAERDAARSLIDRIGAMLGLSSLVRGDPTHDGTILEALGAIIEDRDNGKTVAASLRETHRELTTRIETVAKELDTAVGDISLADLVIAGHRNQEKADQTRIATLEDLVKRREEIHTQMSAIVAEQRESVAAATVQLDEAVAMRDAAGQKAAHLQAEVNEARAAATEMHTQLDALVWALLKVEWSPPSSESFDDGCCPECGGRDWGNREKVHGHRSLDALVAGAPLPCALDQALTRAGLPTQLQRNAERAAIRARAAAALRDAAAEVPR